VDILFRLPNGRRYRERAKAPVKSKSGALRWGQDRERHLVQHGPEPPKKEVPTLEEFAPKFLEGHAKADRHKPSGVASKESIIRFHLVPLLGSQKLDSITNAHVQRLKLHLTDKAAKTVNNVLVRFGYCLLCVEKRPSTISEPMSGYLKRRVQSTGERTCALDPVSWTSFERWIRCPEWPTQSAGGRAGNSMTISKGRRSDWYSTKARRRPVSLATLT
jgi:hypothetical protein